ncbi:hypothetical protein ACJEPY_005439, partial [Escherichia coli]
MTDLSHSREKDKINPVVFYTSAGLILLFSLTTILFRDFSALWIGRTLDWVSKTLNRPGFPGECFICELRLPDHRFRWKHN